MSIFDFGDKEQQDYSNWMHMVRENINKTVEDKSLFYSFNFSTSEPLATEKYAWEQSKEPAKRLSITRSMMRSSLSTLPTLGDDTVEDIPRISDFDLRISQELAVSPIVLLPHRRE
jgi:hypothetical protein